MCRCHIVHSILVEGYCSEALLMCMLCEWQGTQDGSIHQAEIAFVEMWLLSFSDVIVTSAYSTFGYVPHGNFDYNAKTLQYVGCTDHTLVLPPHDSLQSSTSAHILIVKFY